MPTTPKNPDTTGQTIEFKGETFELPALNDIPFSFLEDIEEGRVVAATKSLLGDDQYEKFKATNPSVGEFQEFFSKVNMEVDSPN